VADLAGRAVRLVLGTSEGGVGRHVHALAAALVSVGADVLVCGPAATEQLFGFSRLGVRFEPVDIRNGVDPVAGRRAVRALRPLVAGADILHAHGLRAGYVALRAADRASGVPVLVTWHNAVLGDGPKRRLLAAVERQVARGAVLNLAVSGDLVARIRQLGGTAALAPVGGSRLPPPTRSVDEVRAELGAAGRPLVLAIGRLHEQKGFDTLIAAAALLSARTPQPLLVIAGDGPLRDELTHAAAAAGAPVRLLGRRDDLPDLLAAADVVAMPSRWEGSPLSAHETLFAGRPLVASAVGGLPDLGADRAVDLVSPGDAAALAAAIARLLDDPAAAAALAERGRCRADEWPDSARTAQQVIATYCDVLERP
jgi:glycosyltransferase involved in cell wall biosynthesis